RLSRFFFRRVSATAGSLSDACAFFVVHRSAATLLDKVRLQLCHQPRLHSRDVHNRTSHALSLGMRDPRSLVVAGPAIDLWISILALVGFLVRTLHRRVVTEPAAHAVRASFRNGRSTGRSPSAIRRQYQYARWLVARDLGSSWPAVSRPASF